MIIPALYRPAIVFMATKAENVSWILNLPVWQQ